MRKGAIEFAKPAFENIGPKNPLRHLDARDRALVWSLLSMYSRKEDYAWGPKNHPAEIAGRTAADAAKLADRLEADIFHGSFADDLIPFVGNFAALPQQLKVFSNRLCALLELVGKPGRKSEVFGNQMLILTSEFVRMKLGNPYDEHVAELFQGIGNRDTFLELSGDAIRKKREYFKKQYPVLYAESLKIVRKMISS